MQYFYFTSPNNLDLSPCDLCPRRTSKKCYFLSCLSCDLPPVTLCSLLMVLGEGVSHLQGHVHNGCHSSSCSGPGGGPETLPRGAAWFIHMYVAVDNAWHHHSVTHIQHLSSQPGYKQDSSFANEQMI